MNVYLATPFWTTMRIWRALSISIIDPDVDRGLGRDALRNAACVAPSMDPLRGRLFAFWNAYTACCMLSSNTPFAPGNQS